MIEAIIPNLEPIVQLYVVHILKLYYIFSSIKGEAKKASHDSLDPAVNSTQREANPQKRKKE